MLICWNFSCSFTKGKKTVLVFYKIVKELVFLVCMCQTLELFANH